MKIRSVFTCRQAHRICRGQSGTVSYPKGRNVRILTRLKIGVVRTSWLYDTKQHRLRESENMVLSKTFGPKAPYTLSVKLSDFTVWRHTWGKNWVNCAVFTGNSAGLRTVLSSRLSHTELRSSLTETHSFLSLPADTTISSSQGSHPSKMNKREATLAFIEPYRSLRELYPP
jgi:hypothetical protein